MGAGGSKWGVTPAEWACSHSGKVGDAKLGPIQCSEPFKHLLLPPFSRSFGVFGMAFCFFFLPFPSLRNLVFSNAWCPFTLIQTQKDRGTEQNCNGILGAIITYVPRRYPRKAQPFPKTRTQ